MAELPHVPQGLRIAMRGTLGTDTNVVNRLYMRYSGSAPLGADLLALAAAVGSSWDATVSYAVHEDFTLTDCTITDLTSATSPEATASFSHAGRLSGGRLPADTCMVIGLPVARRYRGGHGRIYVFCGDESKIASEQEWSEAFVSGMQSGWAGFMGDIAAAVWSGGGTLSHVVVSYYHGNTIETHGSPPRARNVPVLRETPLVDQVLAYEARARIGSQRRRLGR